MRHKILVIDDEVYIRKLLKDYFTMQDFLVYTAESAEEGMEKLEIEPDIILLDVNMPGMDGMEFCSTIRDFITCPILFLTAKIDENDRVKGLLSGGDDYILKPFSIEELGARVEAHLRREQRNSTKGSFKFAQDMVISYTNRSVHIKQEPVGLTRMEFDIVEFLSQNKGQIFSKERIYEHVRGYDGESDSSIIAEHIRRIRQKLGTYTNEQYIETVWGVGYQWVG